MTITVYGLPGPQGSKRLVGHDRRGRGILIESSAKVKPWRQAVMWAASQSRVGDDIYLIRGAVAMTVAFTLPRPKSAKKGAFAEKRPDLSKLVRSTEDALTEAGVWEDDARVVRLLAVKLYVGDPGALMSPGAQITVTTSPRARLVEEIRAARKGGQGAGK